MVSLLRKRMAVIGRGVGKGVQTIDPGLMSMWYLDSYAYVLNNPTGLIDPDGAEPQRPASTPTSPPGVDEGYTLG